MLTNNDIEFGELCRNSWAKQTSKPITQREIEFAREIIVAYQAKNLEGTTMTLQDTMRLALDALEAHADIGIKSDKAIEALKAALEQHERQQSSAYQRGYLDGMAKPCTNCADYKAMYIKARDELAVAQQGYKPSCLHGDDDYCKACYMQETTAALQDIIPVQPNIKNQIFTDISAPQPKGLFIDMITEHGPEFVAEIAAIGETAPQPAQGGVARPL